MHHKPDIWATLGPSSFTPEFFASVQDQVSLFRLNMSHMTVANMTARIQQIRDHSAVPICVDTEGAQIRTSVTESRQYRSGDSVVLSRAELTPAEVWSQLRAQDHLAIGFDGLEIVITAVDDHRLTARCVQSGRLDNNKGVHCQTHTVDLPDLTAKDHMAIQRARSMGINTFALSFTRDHRAIRSFQTLLPNCRLIYKIETDSALQDLDRMFQTGTEFLIDRGDLGKSIGADMVPIAQRQIFHASRPYPAVRIAVATNFLESMIDRPYATRAEINDIYTALEQGATSLILAGETAIGRYPVECVSQVERMIALYCQQNTI
jgi:pyruvate kinase